MASPKASRRTTSSLSKESTKCWTTGVPRSCPSSPSWSPPLGVGLAEGCGGGVYSHWQLHPVALVFWPTVALCPALQKPWTRGTTTWCAPPWRSCSTWWSRPTEWERPWCRTSNTSCGFSASSGARHVSSTWLRPCENQSFKLRLWQEKTLRFGLLINIHGSFVSLIGLRYLSICFSHAVCLTLFPRDTRHPPRHRLRPEETVARWAGGGDSADFGAAWRKGRIQSHQGHNPQLPFLRELLRRGGSPWPPSAWATSLHDWCGATIKSTPQWFLL